MRLPIVVGTRGSPLAIAQTRHVCAQLVAAHPALAEDGALRTTVITTSGDRIVDRPLAEIGGKGLFTKEIEEALLDRRIDLAVHSMKDVPTWLPEGLEIAAIPAREDPRDVLIARGGPAVAGIADLPQGARVGTGSLRRQAQLLARRPDIAIVPMRGNVGTRMRKVADGEADATLLALAGLRRLGEDVAGMAVLTPGDMLPAVGQGALGIECRASDDSAKEALQPIVDAATSAAVRCERALLAVLDGSCRMPIAGLAVPDGQGQLRLDALIARPDGSLCHRTQRTGAVADALSIGRDAGAALRAAGGPDWFDP
ncbi:MAG: hydroxymethylbilane synthase [Rhodospirillales bacterium]|nr:hydroxymethylbilane synthase [Rhodospirillales bacterium]MDE0381367.1 hydroxymethylbilane synthase [Rhodospirillales bacterium]